MWDQCVLRCLVGYVAQPFLQQKSDLVLEQFLFHKNFTRCFKANLHNAGTTKGKDVTHCGVHGGVCYFWQFYAARVREGETVVGSSKALYGLEKACSQVDLHIKPNGTALF